MGSKGGCVTYTVGHKYSLGVHMVFCHGPIDDILGIKTADYTAWDSSAATTSRANIEKPDLYGGHSREGGISGEMDLEFGFATQGQNDYLLSQLDAPVPAFRGVFGIVLRRMYLGDSHYIKPWAARLRHDIRHLPDWQPGLARIATEAGGVTGMNPAHIIYAALTNTDWGLGYSTADIDDASFHSAAHRLKNTENFALSLLWDRAISIEDFIDEVKKHIDAVLYIEPTTGLWELHLLRDDYNPDTLPVLDPTNIVEVETFTRRTMAEMANTIVLKYNRHTEDGDLDDSVTVHNTAMIQRLGKIIHSAVNYPGISTPRLALQVASRDLMRISTDLSSGSFVVVANETTEALREGSAFKFSWPKYGVEQEVMRVGAIDFGTLKDGRIRISAIQDVFGTSRAIYSSVPSSGWTDPVSVPVVVAYRRVEELPYWTLVRRYGEDPAVWENLGPDAGVLGALYVKPVADAYSYRLYTRPDTGSYMPRGTFVFTPSGVLAAPIDKNDTSLTAQGLIGTDTVAEDTFAYIDDELVKVLTLNPVTGHINIARGILDTVPAAHAAGARIWFCEGHYGTDAIVMQSGQIVNARACTLTGKGELDIAAAPTNNLTFAARANRPYPPGRVRINTEPYPDHITGALALEWRHRDRLQQTAYLVDQSEGNIGPEAGTTYRLRIYGEGTTLLRTYSGIEATEQAYTIAQEIADSGALGRPNEILRIVLDAQRGGYDAWQAHDHTIECRGYGMFYGNYYGE